MGLFDWLKPGQRKQADAMFARLFTYMTSDTAQNERNPFASTLKPGVDVVPGAVGEFGRISSNPIPVNGPIGEVLYIAQLRNIAGTAFMAHRVGSVGANVDAYELLSLDGRTWDLLFFNMYYDRKSKLVPSGITRALDFGGRPFVYVASGKVEDFPAGLPDALSGDQFIKRPSEILAAIAAATPRPTQHLERLRSLV